MLGSCGGGIVPARDSCQAQRGCRRRGDDAPSDVPAQGPSQPPLLPQAGHVPRPPCIAPAREARGRRSHVWPRARVRISDVAFDFLTLLFVVVSMLVVVVAAATMVVISLALGQAQKHVFVSVLPTAVALAPACVSYAPLSVHSLVEHWTRHDAPFF